LGIFTKRTHGRRDGASHEGGDCGLGEMLFGAGCGGDFRIDAVPDFFVFL
jgi:hypothetical protein